MKNKNYLAVSLLILVGLAIPSLGERKKHEERAKNRPLIRPIPISTVVETNVRCEESRENQIWLEVGVVQNDGAGFTAYVVEHNRKTKIMKLKDVLKNLTQTFEGSTVVYTDAIPTITIVVKPDGDDKVGSITVQKEGPDSYSAGDMKCYPNERMLVPRGSPRIENETVASSPSREEVSNVKKKHANRFIKLGAAAGITTKCKHMPFCIKLNFSDKESLRKAQSALRMEIEGVELVYEYVGPSSPR